MSLYYIHYNDRNEVIVSILEVKETLRTYKVIRGDVTKVRSSINKTDIDLFIKRKTVMFVASMDLQKAWAIWNKGIEDYIIPF